MDDFDKLLSNMIADVRSGKAQKRAKHEKKVAKAKEKALTIPATPVVPKWTEEAVVCIMQVSTCRRCGNEGTSWLPYLYVERWAVINNRRVDSLERITNTNWEVAYGNLKQRIEVREVETCSCPMCFGKLPKGYHYPDQLTLNLPETIQ